MPGDSSARILTPAAEHHSAVPHFVHVFPSFGWGGVPIRIANIINHFGLRYRHTILALDGNGDCRSRLRLDLPVEVVSEQTVSGSFPIRLRRCRAVLRRLQPDLLLTYNWGAIEWAMANRIAPLSRHVHLESGFDVEEADRQLRRRVWFRRAALARSEKIVVPSQTLVDLATRVWKLGSAKVAYIPNGVDYEKFAKPPVPGAIPGFKKEPGEIIVGTVAPLRPVKNISRLVRAFADLAGDANVRLLVLGDGVEKQNLVALANELGISDRVVFAGHVEKVEQAIGWFDIFAVSSDTEQMPNTVVQAMAAARPVVGTDVGDVKLMVAPENRPFIASRGDDAAFCAHLAGLIANPDVRRELGERNQARVREKYSQEKMFRAYEAVFEARHA